MTRATKPLFGPSRTQRLVLALSVSVLLIGLQEVRKPAQAAGSVAFDAVGPSASGASVNGSSLSWNHTITTSGSDLLLTVGIAVGTSWDEDKSVSVTYNGVPMTSAAKVHSNNQTQGFVELFYLTAPAPGTHPVQVTLSGGTAYIEGGSVSFTGVDQTTPVRNITTASGAGTSPSVFVASAAGDMVVDALVYGCSGGSSGTTSRWMREVNCATAGGNAAQSTAPGAPSVNMRYTIASDWWGIVGMNVVAATGGVPDTTPPSVPSGLSATAVSPSQINLSWTPSTDDVGVTGYTIFRNTTQINTTSASSYSDTGLAAGTAYSYTVAAYDAAGNASSPSSSASATTPSTPFTFSLSNGGNKSVVRGSSVPNTITSTLLSGTAQAVSFAASGFPAGASGSFSPGSCTPTCTTTLTIVTGVSTPLATSTITVTGTAGSLSSVTSFTLTVTPDTTSPTVSLSAPANNAMVRGTAVAVNATAFDAVGVSGVQFLLDGANLGAEDTAAPYSRTWNTTTSSGGPHTLSARARDAAGNLGTAATVTVTVDNLAPTGSVVINSGAAVTTSRNSTLTLAAADTITTVTQMRFSNTGTSYSAAEAYAATKAWTLSSGAGTKTVYVQFKDAPGNWSAGFTDTIVFDPTAPIISAVGAVNMTVDSATINWTTDEPSTSQVEYGPTTSYGSMTPLDNALVTSHSVTLTGLAAGTTYNYRVRSTDAASNQRVDTNKLFTTLATVDTTPPSVPTNLAGIVVLPAQINLSWTASTDNVGVTGYAVTRNGMLVGSPTATAFQDTGLASGVYSYLVSARDAAGNTSVAAAVSVNLDPPRLEIIRPAAAETIVGGVIDVTYAALGDLTDVDHVHFTLDANPMVMDLTLDGSYRFINVPEGNHTLQGFLVYGDHTAIPGTNDSVTFTTTVADSTPPLISMTAPLPGAVVSGSILFSADASDDSAIAGVQFLVDGSPVGMEDLTAPYSSTWDSRAVANGTHTITARARDIGGNISTSTPVSVTVTNSSSQEAEFGSWSTPAAWPLVPIHATLLHTGEVMVWDDHTEEQGYYLWNPTTSSFTFFAHTTQNLFCSAHTALADGRTLIMGGTVAGGGVLGIKDVSVFDAVTRNRTALPPMAYARYYPSAITLGDGTVLTVAGNGDASCNGCTIAIPEVYDPASNTWTSLPTANLVMPYYPHLFLLPNGRVIVTGTSEENIPTYVLNMSTKLWSTLDPAVIPSASSAMYLPGKIMKTGFAGSPNVDIAGTRTTYVIDMNAPAPAWRQVPSMAFARAQHMLTSLPDGTVLATGGGTSSYAVDVSTAVYEAEIWNPATETWKTMARMLTPRMYHATSLLLPDGRVLVGGGGRLGFPEQFSAEIYSPPYLFKGPRPVISTAPSTIQYAAAFSLETPNAAGIGKVSLLKLGAATHAYNNEQRFLDLPFSVTDGTHLSISAPAHGNLAPPGYYMLFILDANGVPSVARILQVSATLDAQPPSAPTALNAVGSIGRIDLSWTAATDNVGVMQYNVHRSSASGFTPNAGNRIAQVVTTSYADVGVTGTFFYKVVAEDNAGNLGPASNQASATAPSDLTVPAVAVTSPIEGAVVSGTVQLYAAASDNVGVAGVKFFVDNLQVGAEDTSSPYWAAWNTLSVGNGTHQIQALARDGSGNTATSVVINVTVQQPQGPTGLVAAYGLDEGSGTTATDRTTNNNGSIAGATWTVGRYGSALAFNGISSMVTINDSPSLRMTNGLTLEAWIKPASTGGWRDIVYRGDDNYFLNTNTTSVYGGLTVSSLSMVSGDTILPLNTWTHVAMTYDGNNIKTYVNGVLAGIAPQTGYIAPSTSPLTLGGDLFYGQHFDGVIDEVRVYNRALTEAEIAIDMNTPVASGGAP
jgi:hypothetical protein